jgi:uncharacterized membrane protein YraQ (UPF0718 family)
MKKETIAIISGIIFAVMVSLTSFTNKPIVKTFVAKTTSQAQIYIIKMMGSGYKLENSIVVETSQKMAVGGYDMQYYQSDISSDIILVFTK